MQRFNGCGNADCRDSTGAWQCECQGKYEYQGEETVESLKFAEFTVVCTNCGHVAPWEGQIVDILAKCVLCGYCRIVRKVL